MVWSPLLASDRHRGPHSSELVFLSTGVGFVFSNDLAFMRTGRGLSTALTSATCGDDLVAVLLGVKPTDALQ